MTLTYTGFFLGFYCSLGQTLLLIIITAKCLVHFCLFWYWLGFILYIQYIPNENIYAKQFMCCLIMHSKNYFFLRKYRPELIIILTRNYSIYSIKIWSEKNQSQRCRYVFGLHIRWRWLDVHLIPNWLFMSSTIQKHSGIFDFDF